MSFIHVLYEIVTVFGFPMTDAGYTRAAGIAVLLGHTDIVAGYHKCPACGALIPPQEYTSPFDRKPDVCYGDCPNGHTVIDQLNAMIEVDQAT